MMSTRFSLFCLKKKEDRKEEKRKNKKRGNKQFVQNIKQANETIIWLRPNVEFIKWIALAHYYNLHFIIPKRDAEIENSKEMTKKKEEKNKFEDQIWINSNRC